MTTKEYLYQIRDIRLSIQSNKNELKLIENLADSASGNVLKKVSELKDKINSEIDDYIALENEIKDKILALPDNRYKTLLREYYINCMTLEKVAEFMNRDNDYIRRMHTPAIKYFEKFHGINSN